MISKSKIVGVLLAGVISQNIITSTTMAANIGSVSIDGVNVHLTNTVSEENIIAQLDATNSIDLLDYDSEFFKIQYKADESYISKEFVDVTEATGIVTTMIAELKTEPSADSETIAELSMSQTVNVTGKVKDTNWYEVSYKKEKLYVESKCITGVFLVYLPVVDNPIPPVTVEPVVPVAPVVTVPSYAIVGVNGLNLRGTASTDGSIMSVLNSGSIIDVVENGSEWTKVSYNGATGYVATQYISIHTGEKPAKPSYSSKADEMVAYSKQFIGTPYSWGGTDLRRGVDCSGFTYAVYKQFGITLNRSSRDQVNNGTRVSKSELVPGDLVFFDTSGANNGAISHVGMYIGNGQFIESSSGKNWGISINSLSSEYCTRTYVTACRVLK